MSAVLLDTTRVTSLPWTEVITLSSDTAKVRSVVIDSKKNWDYLFWVDPGGVAAELVPDPTGAVADEATSSPTNFIPLAAGGSFQVQGGTGHADPSLTNVTHWLLSSGTGSSAVKVCVTQRRESAR